MSFANWTWTKVELRLLRRRELDWLRAQLFLLSAIFFGLMGLFLVVHEGVVLQQNPALMPLYPPATVGWLAMSATYFVRSAKRLLILLGVLVLPLLTYFFYQLPTSIDSIYHAIILIESVFGLFGVVICILYSIPLHRFKRYSEIELKLIDLVFLTTVSASIVVQIVARAYDGAELLFRFSVLFAAVGLSVRVSKTLYEIAMLQKKSR